MNKAQKAAAAEKLAAEKRAAAEKLAAEKTNGSEASVVDALKGAGKMPPKKGASGKGSRGPRAVGAALLRIFGCSYGHWSGKTAGIKAFARNIANGSKWNAETGQFDPHPTPIASHAQNRNIAGAMEVAGAKKYEGFVLCSKENIAKVKENIAAFRENYPDSAEYVDSFFTELEGDTYQPHVTAVVAEPVAKA